MLVFIKFVYDEKAIIFLHILSLIIDNNTKIRKLSAFFYKTRMLVFLSRLLLRAV